MRIFAAMLFLIFGAMAPDQVSSETVGRLRAEGTMVIVRRGPEVTPNAGRYAVDPFYTRTSRPVLTREVPSVPRYARPASRRLVIRNDMFYLRIGDHGGVFMARRPPPQHYRHRHTGKHWPRWQQRRPAGRDAWRLR